MAITIKGSQIRDGAIATAKIAGNAVGAAKMDLTDTFDFSSGTVSVATPTADGHAATKGYVDGVASGLYWKDPARAATTANITLSGTQTIDGVSLSAGDRVLVKDQSAGAENGVYVVASGSWSRSGDFDAGSDFPSAAIFVSEGTQYADSGFVCTNDSDPNVGTDAIAFVQFTGLGSITAGDGLSKDGAVLSVNTGAGITISSDAVAIELDTNSGLQTSGDGLKVQTDNGVQASGTGISLRLGNGLQYDGGSAGEKNVEIKLDNNSGLSATGTGVKVNLDTNPGLQLGAGGLSIDLVTNSGLVLDANGLGVNLDTNPGLELGAGGVKVKVKANAGLALDGDGLSAKAINAVLIDGSGNLDLRLDGSTLAKSASGVKIAADGVGIAEQGFRYRSDYLTGTTSAFDLTNFVDTKNHDGVRAFLNGQRMRKVASNPADVSEYTVANDGSTTSLALGGSLEASDLLTVDYVSA